MSDSTRLFAMFVVAPGAAITLAYAIYATVPSSRPLFEGVPAPSASAGRIRPEILQLMTPARRAELATFDLDHARALRERDAAIDRCEKNGGVVAMGFSMSVVCISRGGAVETRIQYPEYPVLDP